MSKIKASELLDYSRIQLHTPLGGLYEVTVTTSVERDLVTLWTIPDNDDTEGQTLTCTPDTLIELVKAPSLTLYGIVTEVGAFNARISRREPAREEAGEDSAAPTRVARPPMGAGAAWQRAYREQQPE